MDFLQDAAPALKPSGPQVQGGWVETPNPAGGPAGLARKEVSRTIESSLISPVSTESGQLVFRAHTSQDLS